MGLTGRVLPNGCSHGIFQGLPFPDTYSQLFKGKFLGLAYLGEVLSVQTGRRVLGFRQ